MSENRKIAKLEIEAPGVECGNCNFSNYLAGEWTVEAGRLSWRADPDALRGRGPSFYSCGECGAEYDGAIFDFGRRQIDPQDFVALVASERDAQDDGR